jgi:hypothetical protein
MTAPDQFPAPVQTARNEAAEVGRDAAERASDVTTAIGDQARRVASETGTQAKNLLDEGLHQLRDQARDGQRRLAESVRTFAGQFRRMSTGNQETGLAGDLVRQATDRAERVASWLESREPGDLLDEVRRFARRRPGMFLAGAAAAGVLAGRLTRNIVASTQDNDAEPRPGWQTTPPSAPAAPAPPPVEQVVPAVPSGMTGPGPVRR